MTDERNRMDGQNLMNAGSAGADAGCVAKAGNKAGIPEVAGAMVITVESIEEYLLWLKGEERAVSTIEKYNRDLLKLLGWLESRPLTRLLAAEWKESLQAGYAAASVNSILAAVNGFFQWMGWRELGIKPLKIQRKTFCGKNKELTREEYRKLVAAAEKMGDFHLSLLLETLCGMGLRVSEVKFITVAAVRMGRAEITIKGKVRTVLIPSKLARKLLKYAKKKGIESGEIFITRTGSSLSRSQIWREMKRLAVAAGVDPEKVFPHNLRHLFARTYYNTCSDLPKLADILGHSSVETTRIYLISTGEEHEKQLEKLGLVS
ncbi:MAG: tyrosine-type recombinase/integrase [Lachnospiraceae bacterium]|nr:tyrosine-type recombinase/integrase [Lachnospiraceae bacterium]